MVATIHRSMAQSCTYRVLPSKGLLRGQEIVFPNALFDTITEKKQQRPFTFLLICGIIFVVKLRNKNSVKSRERSANMSKKTFGSIIKKPNGTLVVKYIERYEVLADGKRKPIYKTESTHSKSRRVAQARLDELEKIFRTKDEKERIDNLRKRSELLQSGIDANRPKTPIGDLFDKYIELLATTEDTIAESTKGLYNIMVNSFTSFMEKEKVLFVEDVTTEQAKAFLAKRKGEVAIERVYQTYDIIKHIYDLFIKAKMMIENPFQGALEKKALKKKQKRDILTDEELKTLLNYEKEDRIQFLFVCSLYTGLRLSDCCLLKWDNVDLKQNLIKVIPLKTQKSTDEPINIPIHPLLLSQIEKASSARKKSDVYVYPQNANGYKDKTINYAVTSIFHKLKLSEKKKTFHSLRHTFISNSANNGTKMHVLQKLVGHSSLKMSMEYYHENREVIDNAINVLPDYTQSQDGEIEIVRLPKDVMDLIRAKSKVGETIANTLRRILAPSTMCESVENTEVENQIVRVNELIDNMVLEGLASA